jgi:uncharacterized membrane protein
MITAPHLRALPPSAAAKLTTQAIGVTVFMALVVAGAFLATVASAARGLASMLAEFVRLATAMLSATVLMLIVILVTVALLIHHLPAHGRRAAGSRLRDRRKPSPAPRMRAQPALAPAGRAQYAAFQDP